jgi:hypothetical protein
MGPYSAKKTSIITPNQFQEAREVMIPWSVVYWTVILWLSMLLMIELQEKKQ